MGKREVPLSLPALVQGFILTVKTEGKAPSTVDFLEGNLRRFLWYARQQGWPDDAQAVDAWKIREFHQPDLTGYLLLQVSKEIIVYQSG